MMTVLATLFILANNLTYTTGAIFMSRTTLSYIIKSFNNLNN